jgi:DNA-directed RNA polymerase specialized sigma24 family protein
MNRIEGNGDETRRDTELLRACAASGSAEAQAILARRYGRLVCGTCRTYVGSSPEAVEYAGRVAFAALAKHAAALAAKDEPHLASWLHDVSMRAAESARERFPGAQGAESDIAALDIAQERREALHVAVQAIPAHGREAILQRYFGGITTEQQARLSCYGAQTIGEHLTQGRTELENRLNTMGYDVTEASLDAWLDAEDEILKKQARVASSWDTAPAGPDADAVRAAAGSAIREMHQAGTRTVLVRSVAAVAIVAVLGAVVFVAKRPRTEPQATHAALTATIESPRGIVVWQNPDGSVDPEPPVSGTKAKFPGTLETGPASEATLALPGEARVFLRGESALVCSQDGRIVLRRGSARVESGKGLTIAAGGLSGHSAWSRFFLLSAGSNGVSRFDVLEGEASVGHAAKPPARVAAGEAACESPSGAFAVIRSDGEEFSPLFGGAFFASAADDYARGTRRLDSPRLAKATARFRARGLDMTAYLGGDSAKMDRLPADEGGASYWGFVPVQGKDEAAIELMVPSEGEALWLRAEVAASPESGTMSLRSAWEGYVPAGLPPALRPSGDVHAGILTTDTPLAKSEWTLKWALVGGLPDGRPLYECEESIGDKATVKGWRAGTLGKQRLMVSGGNARIYSVTGGALEPQNRQANPDAAP